MNLQHLKTQTSACHTGSAKRVTLASSFSHSPDLNCLEILLAVPLKYIRPQPSLFQTPHPGGSKPPKWSPYLRALPLPDFHPATRVALWKHRSDHRSWLSNRQYPALMPTVLTHLGSPHEGSPPTLHSGLFFPPPLPTCRCEE